MKAIEPTPLKNHLLAALPGEVLQRWLPLLELVDLPLGHALYEPGVSLDHVYFPTTAIVSLLYMMEDGATAEIAVSRNSWEINAQNATATASASRGMRNATMMSTNNTAGVWRA